MLSHTYKIVIDSDVGSPGHRKYAVDVLNSTNNFFSMLVTTVQFNGTASNDSQMPIHTPMSTTYISKSREFKKIFQNQHVHIA